jgi:hypothetical protein
MARPRLDTNGIQVIAAVLASVTGALLASSLGTVGTISGTAIASGISTVMAAVYRHYLGRTKDRIRDAAPALVRRPQWHEAPRPATRTRQTLNQGTGTPENRTATGPGARRARRPGDLAQGLEDVTRADIWAGDPTRADIWAGDLTRVDNPVSGPNDPTQILGGLTRNMGGSLYRAPGGARNVPDPTRRMFDATSRNPARRRDAGGTARMAAGPPRRRRTHSRKRAWLRYGGLAIGAFVFVIACVTGVEAGIGKPLSAVVWGKASTGTSIGDVISGTGNTSTPAPSATTPPVGSSSQPAPSATPTPSSSAAPTPTASSSAAPAPTASPSAPATPSSAPATPSSGTNGVSPTQPVQQGASTANSPAPSGAGQ